MELARIFCLEKDNGTYLIEDTLEVPGEPLLTTSLAQVAAGYDRVYWLALETPLRNAVGTVAGIDNVKILVPEHGPDLRLDIDKFHTSYLASAIRRQREAESVALIVDSLNFLVLSSSAARVVELLTYARQVIGINFLCALVHADGVDSEQLLELKCCFAATVRLLPAVASGVYCQYRQMTRKHSGKVVDSDGVMKLLDSGRVVVFPHVAPKVVKGAASVTAAATAAVITAGASDQEPIPGLPFKLSLSSSEREARASVRLPYVNAASRPPTVTAAVAQGGIHYEFDEADDYDEEDPDNDLDF